MHIYLPIAETTVNIFTIFGMGTAVGFLSGMFGVGGGFLITPLLILTGIPAAVSVATGANQVVASSVSGTMTQWRRGNVDFKMGTIMLLGGVVGAFGGVQAVKVLREAGQVELAVSLLYSVFLSSIGVLMLSESLRAMHRARNGGAPSARRAAQHHWIHGLPLKMRFQRSKLYISAIPPLVIGAAVGFLSGILGVGGGFIMVPAMIYLLRMPTKVVIGTSLFQVIFVAGVTTILHAATNQAVDLLLALILMVGGVIGAQFGTQAGLKLRSEHLRALLALLVLGVCVRLMVDLLTTPPELFSIQNVLPRSSL
ncbi:MULTISPECIES: sulfite exporter TauE/SafE family protein [Rhodomicrobium]|uniref:sulfite exporter TauE/SafE family protein n=1 Tax=Rhodomicrobium TaxID=1068 RepID=UPI000B4AA4BE|nr:MULTISPECIES: sulfite exporter TauE/SafE family protein [Rhodomicrobium]